MIDAPNKPKRARWAKTLLNARASQLYQRAETLEREHQARYDALPEGE